MLDICFGESECGALRLALRKSKDGVTYSFRGLELGQIDNENFIEARKKWIDTFFAVCSTKERAKILKEDIARFNQIIEAAKNGEILRIWCATTPCAKSGFYHLVYNLQGFDCPILVIDLPADFSSYRSGDERYDHSWGEVEPKLMEKGVFLQRELLREERNAIASKWAKLMEENADLRLNVNGELSSVSIDYMDNEIMDAAPLDEFKMVTLVGFILAHSRHGVNDSFIAERIEALIKKGELTVIKRAKKREDYYSDTILKRTKEICACDLKSDTVITSEPDDTYEVEIQNREMKGIILSHGAVFVTNGRTTVRLLPSGECDVSPITYETLEWDLRTEPQDSWDYLSETELRNLSDDGFAKISAVFERVNSLLK